MALTQTNIIDIHLIILSPISYQGGGDYRGIYDIGFKRGFMGYIGLLLNAPYKIDSMVWMRIGIRFLVLSLSRRYMRFAWAMRTRGGK
jgi:hypothetical protein